MRPVRTSLLLLAVSGLALGQSPNGASESPVGHDEPTPSLASRSAAGDRVEIAARRLDTSLSRASALLVALRERDALREQEQRETFGRLQSQLADEQARATRLQNEAKGERERAASRIAELTAQVSQLERQGNEQKATSARALLQRQQETAAVKAELERRIEALRTERDEALATALKTRADATARENAVAAELRAERDRREALQAALTELATVVANLRTEVDRLESRPGTPSENSAGGQPSASVPPVRQDPGAAVGRRPD